ncbi:LLM class F420-dependent oxidoreductase [Polymorphospora rubra]|uniref:LLM class F420-dependent oxidoreductase n=2 Tax=Polymorphospora rubra TaxID=338584 RepID=A0A810MWF6_9ACTN|nr:LLM class F420-dependent oxidoreductase [Polymorphospora rubra]
MGMRPLRFGLVWNGTGSPVDVARRAEEAGYASLLFPDHTGMVAPIPAMAAAAAATHRIRLGTQVVNIAFRPLGALAQELAAVDIVSGGRLDIGLGAGYAESEVRSLGLPFPSAGARIREVARALDLLPRLFAGETVTEGGSAYGRLDGFRLEPAPPQGAAVPLMVGGNGDRLLAVGAERADIVQFSGFSPTPDGPDFGNFSDDGVAERIAYLRETAGDRFDDIELSVLVQWAGVVPDPRARVAAMELPGIGVDQVLTSPFALLGTSVDEICARLVDLRDRHGVSYVTVFDRQSYGFDEVVARLAGDAAARR